MGLDPAGVMDHAERLSQNLEALGVDNLGSLSLQELMYRIDYNLPCNNLSRRRLLHPFISWLHERLTIIDNSDEQIVRTEIQTWVDALRSSHIPDTVLAESFRVWESEHVKIEPLSARRLGLAWIELKEILNLDEKTKHSNQDQGGRLAPKESSVELSQAPDSHEPNYPLGPISRQEDVNMDDHGGDIHPDRGRQSGKEGGVGINDGHWGGMHPDRFRQSLQDDEVEEEQADEPDLSFLTGANHLIYQEQMKNAPPSAIIKNQVVRNAERRQARREARKQQKEQTASATLHQEQSRDLRQDQEGGKCHCGHCGSEGHPTEKFPTELLPENVVQPVNGTFTCVYCGSRNLCIGYCRKNPLHASVNQGRIRAGIWEAIPSRTLTASPGPHGSGRHARDYEWQSDGKFSTDSVDHDREHGEVHDKYYQRNHEQNHDHSRDHKRNRGHNSRDHNGNHHRHDRNHERESDGKFDKGAYLHENLDYGDDHGKSYDRRSGQDHSHHTGDHNRGRSNDHNMTYDRGHNGNRDDRDWDDAGAGKDSDGRDERLLQQRSRNTEEHRASRDSNRRRSPSPKTHRHRKERPRIDRYRSSKQASHNNSRRSRSPENKDRRTSSRRLRSPIQDNLHSVSPSEERDHVLEVRGVDRIFNGQEADEAEGTSPGHESRDQTFDHPSRTILQQKKFSGVLSYSDSLEATEDDVTPPGSTHSTPSDSGFTREQFSIALDELIREIANEAPPTAEMVGELSTAPLEGPKPAEDPDPEGISQASEDIRPVSPLKTTITWFGMIVTSQKQTGDILSDSLSELIIRKSQSAECNKVPPLKLGVSMKPKPNNSGSLYDSEILDMMKKLNRENIWLHKAQRSRARDLLTAKMDADGSNETPDLTEVKVPEIPGHETGWEAGVNQELNCAIEAEGSSEQHDIIMANDGVERNVEVGVPASANDSFMAVDVSSGYLGVSVSALMETLCHTEEPTSGEPRVNLPAPNECHVMTRDFDQQQGVEGHTTTDDQAMTDALLTPEQKITQSTDEMTDDIRTVGRLSEDDQPSDELFVSAEESFISLDTSDSSMTEPGDQLMDEVDMPAQDAAHD